MNNNLTDCWIDSTNNMCVTVEISNYICQVGLVQKTRNIISLKLGLINLIWHLHTIKRNIGMIFHQFSVAYSCSSLTMKLKTDVLSSWTLWIIPSMLASNIFSSRCKTLLITQLCYKEQRVEIIFQKVQKGKSKQ